MEVARPREYRMPIGGVVEVLGQHNVGFAESWIFHGGLDRRVRGTCRDQDGSVLRLYVRQRLRIPRRQDMKNTHTTNAAHADGTS